VEEGGLGAEGGFSGRLRFVRFFGALYVASSLSSPVPTSATLYDVLCCPDWGSAG
jgi:hypothetical protein